MTLRNPEYTKIETCEKQQFSVPSWAPPKHWIFNLNPDLSSGQV